MATFKIYTNAALTIEFSGSIASAQSSDGTTPRQDFQFWLGSIASGKTLQADSAPGVDQITLSVVDSAASTGHAASELKLATNQAGLAAGGTTLNLGTSILSGVANAKEFWVGWKDATGVVGTSTELEVQTNLCREI